MLPAIGLAIAGIVDKVLGSVLPDPAARAKATVDILDKLAALDLGQMKVNEESAKHESVFVAGPRPFILWVCGFAIAYEYLLAPLVMWGSQIAGYDLPVPWTISDNLWELMAGLLGLGALRSYDKIKGATSGVFK